MNRGAILLVALLVLGSAIPSQADATEDYSTTTPPTPPFPAPYTDYVVYPQSQSPDHRYAFIYPSRSVLFDLPKAQMFLITLKPFHVVTQMPDYDGYLAVTSNGFFVANWARDSSAVVIINGSKWGPGTVILLPLHDGKPGKAVDLTAEISKLVQPDFDKVKPEPFNDNYPFIFDDDDHVTTNSHDELVRDDGWTINDRNQVIINCTCSSNPKQMSGMKSWVGTVKGLWDIAQGKFIEEKFARTFSGQYPEN